MSKMTPIFQEFFGRRQVVDVVIDKIKKPGLLTASLSGLSALTAKTMSHIIRVLFRTSRPSLLLPQKQTKHVFKPFSSKMYQIEYQIDN